MFLFLREYISFLHGLQQAREPLYQVFYSPTTFPLVFAHTYEIRLFPLVAVQPRNSVRGWNSADSQRRKGQHNRHRDLLAVRGGCANPGPRVHSQGGRVPSVHLRPESKLQAVAVHAQRLFQCQLQHKHSRPEHTNTGNNREDIKWIKCDSHKLNTAINISFQFVKSTTVHLIRIRWIC